MTQLRDGVYNLQLMPNWSLNFFVYLYKFQRLSLIIFINSTLFRCSMPNSVAPRKKVYEVSKVGDLRRGLPEGSLFNSYYTEIYGRALLHSLDCSTLPLIFAL